MEQLKNKLMRDRQFSDQEAIVKALIKKPSQKIRRNIPGGTTLLDQIDISMLTKACYNWLRGIRNFKEVTLSLADNPDKFRLREQKIVDFDTRGPAPTWETHPKGVRYLAELIAETMTKNKFVKIVAKEDGLYLYSDAEDKFSSKRKATKADYDVMAKNLEEGETESFTIGDLIRNEDWVPHLEFTPRSRPQYSGL